MFEVRQFVDPDNAIRIVYPSLLTMNLKLMSNIYINLSIRIKFIQN